MTTSAPLPELVRRAVAGDVDAASAVYDETIDAVWRVALLTAGAPGPAEAAVASAYRALFDDAVAPHHDVRSDLLRRVYVTARSASSLGWAGEPAQHRGRRRRRPRRLPARAVRPRPELHPGREGAPA